MIADNAQTLANGLVLGFLLPAWILCGVTDWWFHRRTDIAHTSGWRESGLHVLLISQGAVAVLAGLFLEINAAVILLMLAMLGAHELTTFIDVRYAVPRRAVGASEQRIHDYLTAIPMTALGIVLVTHAPQTLALVGLGAEIADFSIRWKEPMLPAAYLAAFLAFAAVNAFVYAEEFLRCVRNR